ncbi:unnamed protein product, partial [Musa acuminata subsp. malaccensis]
MAAAVGREEGEEDEQGRKKRLCPWLRLRLQHCSWERKKGKGEKEAADGIAAAAAATAYAA